MRGSKNLYSRILGGIGKGSEGQTQLQYFNLAMENVLKGLPDKISCPDIIHKCTSRPGMSSQNGDVALIDIVLNVHTWSYHKFRIQTKRIFPVRYCF
jgi:hypothetical protein